MRNTFEKYLKETEQRTLFKTVDACSCVLARRDAQWMRLMRYTGLRVSAVAALTVGAAESALSTRRLQYKALKKRRTVMREQLVTRKVEKCLRALLKIRREMGFAPEFDAPLIMSRKRNGLSVRSFQARVCHWTEAAGLGLNVTPHWFRHSLAKSIMRTSESQDPRAIVADVLDHESIETTAVYTWPDRADVDRALERAQ